QRVADPQPGEPEGLRKCARDYEVRVARQPSRTVGHAKRRRVFVIRLVEHHEHVLRNRLQERIERILGEPGSRRIVRIGDEHHPRPRPDRGDDRNRIVAEWLDDVPRPRRRNARGRARRLDRGRIDREGILRVDRLDARNQEGLDEQHQDVVRAVAERYLRDVDAELPLELRVRLPRHVGLETPHARRSEAFEPVVPGHCTARALSTPWIPPIFSTSPAGTLPSMSINVYATSPFDLLSRSEILRPASASRVEICPTMLGTLLFAIAIRAVAGTRGNAASGKFTECRMFPFSRKSRSVSATIAALFSSASLVDAPRCGSAMTPATPRVAADEKSHT